MLSRIFAKSNSINIGKRFLNLQEYQCKKILEDNGLVVQRFGVAKNPESALEIAKKLKAAEYVIKAQILAGGRGKGVFTSGFKGGVHLTKDPNVVSDIARNMLGNFLVTKQTPSDGVLVKEITVCEALDIVKETYIAVLLDPSTGKPVIVGSPCGGMDIEDVAKTNPDKIYKIPVDIATGPTKSQCIEMAKNLEFSPKYVEEAAEQIKKLYYLLIKVDATQVEINPFAVASNNKVVCFDAKINFDDNAQFRQKHIFDLNDNSETPAMEMKATEAGLTYIQMDGNIGCLVNGAGLAMATLDLVKLYGGNPSNFLDLGGTADEDRVLTALNIFSQDSRVDKIFINVFGGIVDCNMIANGILNAKKKIKNLQPVVMRLKGTNFTKAKKSVKDFGDPNIYLIDEFEEAAKTVCQLKV